MLPMTQQYMCYGLKTIVFLFHDIKQATDKVLPSPSTACPPEGLLPSIHLLLLPHLSVLLLDPVLGWCVGEEGVVVCVGEE